MTRLSLDYRALYHKMNVLNFPNISWKMIYVLCIALSMVMLVFYVYSVNELTRGYFVVKNYNKQVSSLLEENRNLETNLAKTSFLAEVMAKAGELSFEKTTNIQYIQIQTQDGSLAKADYINK